ncbi:hypothetical protein MBLNU457_5764t1 [Dothideomycetes sp. NU457]
MAFQVLESWWTLLFGYFVLVAVRLLVLHPAWRPLRKSRKRGQPTHLLIVLGSGGHTAEMIAMLRNSIQGRPDRSGNPTSKSLDWSAFTHRTWVVSSGDHFSAARAKDFENEVSDSASETDMKHAGGLETFTIVTVPRARKIHQPLLTTPFSSLQCLWACLRLLVSHKHGYPDLILTNGPATATILVWATLLVRFIDMWHMDAQRKMRTVYVESWARVKKLSLSGRLLCWVADRVLVQWPQLDGVQGRGEYLGVLV